jgi:hypothetical protein
LYIFEDLLKGKLVRVHNIMRDGGEVEQLHPFFTWILNGGEWAASRHAQLTPIPIG